MKERKLYICDYCGAQYKEEVRCAECKKSHVEINKIRDVIITHMGNILIVWRQFLKMEVLHITRGKMHVSKGEKWINI